MKLGLWETAIRIVVQGKAIHKSVLAAAGAVLFRKSIRAPATKRLKMTVPRGCGPDDPPLGQCPGWCEKPADHDWQDEWADGPMREHLCTVDQIDEFNAVLVREYERYTPRGRVRQREIELDLDGGKGWDVAGERRLIAAITDAIDRFQEPVR